MVLGTVRLLLLTLLVILRIPTATGANGCSDDATIAITVNNASPTATIANNSSSSEVTCLLTSIDFTASGVGTGGSYSWDNSLWFCC